MVTRVIPDEILVARAQAGDTLAADVLVRRHERFAYAVWRTDGHQTHLTDAEDMRQEALHGLYGAIRSYRPDRGVSFRSFAGICVRRWIYTIVKRDLTEGRYTKTPPLSLDAPLNGEYGDMFLGEAVPDPRPDRREVTLDLIALFEFIASDLSAPERECLIRIARGDSYPEIVEALRELPRGRGAAAPWSEKTVDNAVQRARRKCRAFLDQREAA